MGNCQAAEEAVVVVQHPGDGNVRVDRMYWSISANEVMSSNPGHYVALVIPYNSSSSSNNTDNHNIQPSLKLLRPTDTLHLGHVYRLITFEDVIKEFATKKKSVKLGKLLEASGTVTLHNTDKSGAARSKLDHNQKEQEESGSGSSRSTSSRRLGNRHHVGGVQWKPALQSIAEVET